MTTRDIAAHLKELYHVDVSAEFISQVTNSVAQEVNDWQNRPLDAVHPIMYLALKNVAEKWNRPVQNWGGVVNQLMIMFEERMAVG